MQKLSREVFQRIEEYIMTHSRKLEQERFKFVLGNGSSRAVVEALKQYQNEDGGFGHGLEPDFVLPTSSPMATTVAFQIIEEVQPEHAEEFIRQGIDYFENTFNLERSGWFALPAEVNAYPHAPWWNHLPEKGMTVIDYSWGNPSAEIIGYLSKYRVYGNKLDVDALIQHATAYLLQKKEFHSEHEIYCYLRMYRCLSREQQLALDAQLTAAVQSLVKLIPADWAQYTPQPVHFVPESGQSMFGLTEAAINTNLDYLIGLLNTQGAIFPNWKWSDYPEAWSTARIHWTGELTVRVLKILHSFDRIES